MLKKLRHAAVVGCVAMLVVSVAQAAPIGTLKQFRIPTANGNPDEITQVRKRKRMLGGREIPPGVEIFEVHGPFFFGAADKLREVTSEIAKPPKVLILRMRNVPAIDATGLHALEQMARKCAAQGTTLLLTEIASQPLRAIVRAGKLEAFGGREHLARSLDLALDRAAAIVD